MQAAGKRQRRERQERRTVGGGPLRVDRGGAVGGQPDAEDGTLRRTSARCTVYGGLEYDVGAEKCGLGAGELIERTSSVVEEEEKKDDEPRDSVGDRDAGPVFARQ